MKNYKHNYSLFSLVIEASDHDGIYTNSAFYQYGNLVCFGIPENEYKEKYSEVESNYSQWYFLKDGKCFTENFLHCPTSSLREQTFISLMEDFEKNYSNYSKTETPAIVSDVVYISATLDDKEYIVSTSETYIDEEGNDKDQHILKMLSTEIGGTYEQLYTGLV
ncbi:hypothetical protein ACFIPR_003218 [Enterobacter kobei]